MGGQTPHLIGGQNDKSETGEGKRQESEIQSLVLKSKV